MARRTSRFLSVEIKPAASAMEQPQERPAAGAEACGEERGVSPAAEERVEERISLLLRCSRRASALALEAQGSNSVSLAGLRLRALGHHQFNRFRPVSGEESREGSPRSGRLAGGTFCASAWRGAARVPSQACDLSSVLSCHCGPCCLSSTPSKFQDGGGAQPAFRTRILRCPDAPFVYCSTRALMLSRQQFLGRIWCQGTLV